MDGALRKGVAVVAACLALMVCMAFANAAVAHADDEVAELNVKVEETAKQYNEAKQHAKDVEKRIADNQAKIEKLQGEIEAEKGESNDAVRSLYMYQRQTPSLINLVFSTDDVRSLFGTLDYLNRYEDMHMEVIQAQMARKQDLQATDAQLQADMAEASEAEAAAEQALKEAQAAREEAMRRAAEEAARQLKEAQEEAARKAAEAERQRELEKQQAEQQKAENAEDDGEEEVGKNAENPEYSGDADAVAEGSISSEDVAWDSPKEEFVSMWGERINNYLGGSPLSGYGENFAEAAWNYGVDPRWSPAISCVESSKGAICFRSHNAWGWGNSGWGSWEEAIDAHVSGLSRGYGFSLTLAAARKYCPPTYQDWYNKCLSEMNKI